MDGEKNDGVVVGVFTHEEYHTVLDALDVAWKWYGSNGRMDEKRQVAKLRDAMYKVLKEEVI
jgi:hypothetical protein